MSASSIACSSRRKGSKRRVRLGVQLGMALRPKPDPKNALVVLELLKMSDKARRVAQVSDKNGRSEPCMFLDK